MNCRGKEFGILARIVGAVGLALMVGGCQIVATKVPDETTSAAASPPPTAPTAATPAASSPPVEIHGAATPVPVMPPESSGPLIRQNGSGASVGRGTAQPPAVGPQGDVTLNYVDTDIREIIRVILGDMLHVNYSIDPRFQGNVTIQTTTPLKREQLLSTLDVLVAQVGGSIVYENGVFRITSAGNALIVPPIVSSSSPAEGSEILPLRYASAKQLAAMLAPYVGDAAHIIPDPTRNVLVVTGPALARQSVIELVRVFDVDYLAGQSYALFPVKSGEPDKIATDLEHALQIDADGPLAGVIKVVPILQANAIMVIAQQPAYLDRAAHLIAQLDVVADEAGRNVYVYNLRNTEAADIQPVIQTAFNPAHAGNAENAGAGAGGLPPTSTPAQVSAPGAAPNAAANAPLAAQASTGGTTTPTPAMASSILSGTQSPASSGSPTTAQAASVAAAPGAPQIIADVKGNSLIIVATQAEYEKIAAALRQLDVLPAQVLVEATIAEVTLNKALQYGTQFFFNNAEATATLSNAQSVTPTTINPAAPLSSAALFSPALAPSFPGLAVTRLAGSQQYAIQALQSVTDVHVISAPKILILNQQQASIQVGSLVPIITQSATAVGTAGAPVVNSVAYQPTGIILNVTPQIGTGGMVSLDIDQEVSDVVATTSSTINSPTFTEQRFKSEVVVQDGETIGLAGLISDNKSVGNSGIPFLREIPVLGALFSTQNNTDVRTELLVLITPRVVHDDREARGITEELKRKLAPPAALVQ